MCNWKWSLPESALAAPQGRYFANYTPESGELKISTIILRVNSENYSTNPLS